LTPGAVPKAARRCHDRGVIVARSRNRMTFTLRRHRRATPRQIPPSATDFCLRSTGTNFSIATDVYKIILDELEPPVHLGNVMSLFHQITKTAPRAAFAGDCVDYRSFSGNDVCPGNQMPRLAISSRHLSRGVELTTWRRT